MILVEKARHYFDFDRNESEQDLYSVLNPVTWFCRVFGIFPLSLKGPVGKRKYSTSDISIFYNLITLALSLTTFSISLWIVDHETIKLPNHITVAASLHMEFTIAAWSMVVIIVTPIVTRDNFANAVDTLSLQDKMLRELGIRIDHAAELKGYYKRLGMNVLVMTGLFAYDYKFQLHFNSGYPMVWLSLTYSNIIRIICISLYVEIIDTLRLRFAVLNEYLTMMIKKTNNLSISTIMPTPVDNYDRLRSIAKIHGVLYEVVRNVNKMFGLSILTTAIYALKLLVTCTFLITQEFKGQVDVSWMRTVGYSNRAMICFIHIVYVIMACSLARTQANLMEKLVHKFLNNESVTPFSTMLRSFSLQLYHERVEFSAAGIFTLDVTLLQSIIGTVATVVVILLQLDVTFSRELVPQSANNTLN